MKVRVRGGNIVLCFALAWGVREKKRREKIDGGEEGDIYWSRAKEADRRVQLVLSPCVLFAACPHSQVNKQLI